MKALIVVSFGSSFSEAIRTLEGVELYIYKAFLKKHRGSADLYTAFTSDFIRKKLAAQGIDKKSVEEVLIELEQKGYKEVYIQPTHIIPGQEYEKISRLCEAWKDKFESLSLGEPLIHDAESILAVAKTLQKIHTTIGTKEAILYMGHGTGHVSNFIYPALQTAFRTNGFSHGYIATVEGWPELKDAIKLMKEDGYKRVYLAPMLLIAGEHVLKDMIGDEPDSWKNVLAAEGFDVRYSNQGLSEFEEILELYLK